MQEDPETPAQAPLRGLVLAPYGRDAQLLGGALAEIGGQPFLCADLDALLAQIRSGLADLLIISDDALVSGGDDRLLGVLRGHSSAGDDILPLVLLTSSTELLHPLTRFSSVVVVAKPTRRGILDSVLRGAMDTRRRMLQLQIQRQELEERSRNLQAIAEELESRNLSLADAMNAKDRFVATMSHELRTPLNAMLSYADLLDLEINGPINETQRAHLHRIVSSGRHLLDLIGQVLDFAKLNAGQLGVEACPVDLPKEVEDVVSLVAPGASFRGLRLSVLRPSEALPPAYGDRLRVRQVLLNLLSNAIKFTNRGGVTIRFESDGARAVSVLVEDTGIGIASDQMPRLFQDFYQADNRLTRKHDGSGLGLAISKRLALLMGGDLSAASQLGRGSAFTFTLPLVPEMRGEARNGP